MKISLAMAFFASVLLSGCTHITSPARKHALDLNTPYWLDYDASRRGTLIAPASMTVKTCSEPSPDVALNLVAKIQASLKKPEAGEISGTADFNTAVVKLAERTQMVMFLRESLYRLCEQSMNNNLSKDEILSAYIKVIETAKLITETDREKAKEAAANAIMKLTPEQAERIR